MPTLAASRAIVDNMAKVTTEQLLTFLKIAWTKYVKAKIEPGSQPFSTNITLFLT
jgi:hypothetical protein